MEPSATMDTFTAAMIADGAMEPRDEEHYLEAWQFLVDTGLAWTLQGRIGRQAFDMIEAGHISPPS